jgi:hypothetical protein
MIGSSRTHSLFHLMLFGAVLFNFFFIVKTLAVEPDKIIRGRYDFSHLFSAALMVREGEGKLLYDYQSQLQRQSTIFNRFPEEGALPFFYLSYITLIWIPLTYFDYLTAFIVWSLINLFMLSAVAALLEKHLPLAREIVRAPLWLALFGFAPVSILLIQGQVSALILLIYTVAFHFFTRSRPFQAGAVLALALFKFQFVLPFVGIFFLLREWRFIWGFLTASILPIGISLYITGSQQALIHIKLLLHTNKTATEESTSLAYGIYPLHMANIRGLLSLLLKFIMPDKIIIGAVILLSCILVLWAVNRASDDLNLKFALASLLTLLISYHCLLHDVSLLFLPTVILMDFFRSRGNRTKAERIAFILLSSSLWIVLLGFGLVSLVALAIFWLLRFCLRAPNKQKIDAMPLHAY